MHLSSISIQIKLSILAQHIFKSSTPSSPPPSAALSFGFVFSAFEHSLYLSLPLSLSNYLPCVCNETLPFLWQRALETWCIKCHMWRMRNFSFSPQAASSAAEAFNCSVHLSSPAVMFHMLFVQCLVLQVASPPPLSHSFSHSCSSTRSLLFLIRSVDV